MLEGDAGEERGVAFTQGDPVFEAIEEMEHFAVASKAGGIEGGVGESALAP